MNNCVCECTHNILRGFEVAIQNVYTSAMFQDIYLRLIQYVSSRQPKMNCLEPGVIITRLSGWLSQITSYISNISQNIVVTIVAHIFMHTFYKI